MSCSKLTEEEGSSTDVKETEKVVDGTRTFPEKVEVRPPYRPWCMQLPQESQVPC